MEYNYTDNRFIRPGKSAYNPNPIQRPTRRKSLQGVNSVHPCSRLDPSKTLRCQDHGGRQDKEDEAARARDQTECAPIREIQERTYTDEPNAARINCSEIRH
jgi:hypothetical protein